MYYYSPEKGRFHIESLKRYYGVETPEQAEQQGFMPLDMTVPSHNRLTQYCVDNGTKVEGDRAYVDWEVKDLPKEVIEKNLTEEYNKQVEQYMDKVAQAKGYDDRRSCALRAGFEGPFKEEGQAFAVWMDTCFAELYNFLQEVKAGVKPIPNNFEEVKAILPVAPWEPKEEANKFDIFRNIF